MNISVQLYVPKDLIESRVEKFADKITYNTASIMLQRTQPHVPYRTGEMARDTMARGVRGGNKRYTLGNDKADYAKYVWKFPQSINWTNPSSYAQWFMTEFRNSKEKILSQAINQAKKVIK